MIRTLALSMTVVTGVLLQSMTPGWAGQEANTVGGVGLHGFDPVAYFVSKSARKGDPGITSTHNGVTYEFASAQNKALFDGAPDKYAPQYGGFCAYAVSKGYKADIDPHAFSVVDGKLYVNYSHEVGREFNKKPRSYVKSADANWPDVKGQDKVIR